MEVCFGVGQNAVTRAESQQQGNKNRTCKGRRGAGGGKQTPGTSNSSAVMDPTSAVSSPWISAAHAAETPRSTNPLSAHS